MGKFIDITGNIYGKRSKIMGKEVKFSDEYRTCFLCKRTETAYNRLEVHHIFQNGNRDKSDYYGLTVLLCAGCHREKPWAAHQSGKTMEYLHKYGQRKAMKEQGWTVEQFKEVFGTNYL